MALPRLPRLVRSLDEIFDVLPHDPRTYDYDTEEGADKDSENAQFCRAAAISILDDMESKNLVFSTEHTEAADLYIQARRDLTARFGQTVTRITALWDAEEMERKAKSEETGSVARSQGEPNQQKPTSETIEGETAQHETHGASTRKDSSANKDADASQENWADMVEEDAKMDKTRVPGSSWAHIASLGPSNATRSSTLSLGGVMFERKNKITGTLFFSVDKIDLKGLNSFAFDTSKTWPKFRGQDSARRPVFKEPELGSYLETCAKTGIPYLSMHHAQLTYHPRLRRDPAQHRQWMEDHGFYNTCDESKAQRRDGRNPRGPKCDHGWPCCCSNQSDAPRKYTWSDTDSHEAHCEFGIRCNKMTVRTRQFFDFCLNSGLHDDLPSVDHSRARGTICRSRTESSNKQKGPSVMTNALPPGATKGGQNGGSPVSTPKLNSAGKHSSNATAHAGQKANTTPATASMQGTPQSARSERQSGLQSASVPSAGKRSTGKQSGDIASSTKPKAPPKGPKPQSTLKAPKAEANSKAKPGEPQISKKASLESL